MISIMRIASATIFVLVLAALAWFYLGSSNQLPSAVQTQADLFAQSAFDQIASSSAAATEGAPALAASTTDVSSTASEKGTMQPSKTTSKNIKNAMHATLHTSLGDITIEFFSTGAPNTVENFKKLASEGFYDGTKFHRVIKNFMIQGGDPLTKDDAMQARWGTGGPGYQFADEIRADNHNVVGTISMANAGPNTNGSQFFINVNDNSYLDGKHTTFGKVTAGMDVVEKIESTPTAQNDRPVTPVVVTSVTLE